MARRSCSQAMVCCTSRGCRTRVRRRSSDLGIQRLGAYTVRASCDDWLSVRNHTSTHAGCILYIITVIKYTQNIFKLRLKSLISREKKTEQNRTEHGPCVGSIDRGWATGPPLGHRLGWGVCVCVCVCTPQAHTTPPLTSPCVHPSEVPWCHHKDGPGRVERRAREWCRFDGSI